MEDFGTKLKTLRESKGLSQTELAKELFVTRSAVAKWEQDRGFPNIESLRHISRLFDVSIDDLVSDKEIKILEVTANKKLSLRTKIVIILSVFLAAIIITGSVLLGLFCPRKLSTYLKINPEDVISVYVKDYVYVDEESGNGHYEFRRQDLKPENIPDFLNDVKNIKAVPCYDSYRVAGVSFYIWTNKDGQMVTYEIDGYRIKGLPQGVVRYYGISEKIEALLQAYDLYDAVYAH